MNIKKFFIFFFVFSLLGSISLLSGVNAVLNDPIVYYSFDTPNPLTNLGSNGGVATNYGATITTGKLGNGYNFNNQYINTGNLPLTSSFSISVWVDNYDAANIYQRILSSNGFTGTTGWYSQITSTNQIQTAITSNNDWKMPSAIITKNIWQHFVFVNSGANQKIYKNNILILNTNYNSNVNFNGDSLNIGKLLWSGGNYYAYNIKIDEIGIWKRVLTTTEITQLYNNGNGLNLYSVTTPPTPKIQTNLTSYYNSENISIKLNTTTNTNMSYVLDNGIETNIGNNINQTSLTLNNLNDSLHNITFISTDSSGQINTSSSFEINPYQYIYLNDDLRSIAVTNFSLNTISYSDYAKIRYNDLLEGNNILSFSKGGYDSKNFSFNVTLQTPLNISLNVTPSNLFFTLKDFTTSSSLINWQLKIKKDNILLNSFNVSSTYQLLYNDTYQGNLEFIFEKVGYNPSYYYIDFQSGSSVTETIHLLNTSANLLMPIVVKDVLGTSYLEGVSVNLYGIKNNQEYFIDEQITDFAGKVYFTLSPDYLYKIIISKNGYLTTNYKISSTETSYTFLIPESSTSLNYVYAGFSYLIELFIQNNKTYVKAQYTDESSLINKVTLNIGNLSNYSIISSTDSLLVELPSNYTYTSANLEVIRNSKTYNFYKNFVNNDFILNSSVSKSATSYIPDQADKTLIVLLVVFFSILVGFIYFGQVGGFLSGIISLLSLWYLDLLSIYLAMPLILFLLLMFGFYRGGDY